MPSYTIEKFKIHDSLNANHELQGLSWSIDANNMVTIRWDWPKEISYKIAIVFEIEKFESTVSEDSLESLLKKNDNPVIITKSLDKYYSKSIGGVRKKFKVFPAKFGEDNEIIIIDQKSGNVTDTLLKKIKVDYNITYQQIMFSSYKRVNLHLKPSELLMPDALIYEKYSNNYLVCRYPLEVTLNNSIFYIKKHEDIKIVASEPYKDTVDILL